jgi:hypothetical protein
METGLTIQQVAQQTDLSIDTLRYCERIGLLGGIRRTNGPLYTYDVRHAEPLDHPSSCTARCSKSGTAIVDAAHRLRMRLREVHGVIPAEGLDVVGECEENPEARRFAMHAFGTQFAEVHVNLDSDEVRVPHLLGVIASGHITKVSRGAGRTWSSSTILRQVFCHKKRNRLQWARHRRGICQLYLGRITNCVHRLYELSLLCRCCYAWPQERPLPKSKLLYYVDGLSGGYRYFFTTCLTCVGVQLDCEQ